MLHACGITSFLNPIHVSLGTSDVDGKSGDAHKDQNTIVRCLTGDIKTTAEDFVVVEVDPTGQRTDADPYTFPAVDAIPEAAHAVKKSGVEGTGGEWGYHMGAHDEAATIVEKAVPPTRSLNELQQLLADQAPLLESVFGSATSVGGKVNATFTQADLTVLIRDMQLSAQGAMPLPPAKNNTAPSSSSPTAPAAKTWWRCGCHCLGDFADKKERQIMHSLLRYCFPHLRSYAEVSTASSDASEAAASVLSCFLDLHFILFSATLGTEAALCVARWAVAAQAARQERNLDDTARRALQSATLLVDNIVPASVGKGVCFASFDALKETMRRTMRGVICSDEHGSTGQAHNNAVPYSSLNGEEQVLTLPLLTDKDVRRHVHEVLRRFYPFIKCQVRGGQVVLYYSPKPTMKSTTDNYTASRASAASKDIMLGVRRPREDEDAEEVNRTPNSENTNVTSHPNSAFLHFIVRKRNLDTAEMKHLIGEYCGLRDGAVCATGMKDKKAVTTQRCSIPLAHASLGAQKGCAALAAATPRSPVILRWPADPQNSYASVLCATSRSGPVHLGQLQGNWFSVQVRNVRWATAGEIRRWRGITDEQVGNSKGVEKFVSKDACVCPESDIECFGAFLESRFHQCVNQGFVNYFGQQRFGETIERADDHTGVHLFAGRWVDAVRSLYRAYPDVYDAFPEKMEARFVPGNSRDAQVMTHALRQAYRMYFSEHTLTNYDVQSNSALWTQLCEKAITEGVPYYLRSLWVHAGQSVFFNLAASFIVDGIKGTSNTALDDLPPLSHANIAKAYLPLGGYQANRTSSLEGEQSEQNNEAWQPWLAAAVDHALRTLRWTREQAFEQRKVAGVPVPGSWRALVVRPHGAVLRWNAADEASASPPLVVDSATSDGKASLPSVQLSFGLPSSSYATVFLREVLGCDKWW